LEDKIREGEEGQERRERGCPVSGGRRSEGGEEGIKQENWSTLGEPGRADGEVVKNLAGVPASSVSRRDLKNHTFKPLVKDPPACKGGRGLPDANGFTILPRIATPGRSPGGWKRWES